ncbi:hypothetical protein [uncultured Paracoccus sp.]|nr:hypothetical protein [uncultured Paracoccus sp.]
MKAMYTAFLAIAVIGVMAAVGLNSVGHSTAEAWQAGGGAVRLQGEPVNR